MGFPLPKCHNIYTCIDLQTDAQHVVVIQGGIVQMQGIPGRRQNNVIHFESRREKNNDSVFSLMVITAFSSDINIICCMSALSDTNYIVLTFFITYTFQARNSTFKMLFKVSVWIPGRNTLRFLTALWVPSLSVTCERWFLWSTVVYQLWCVNCFSGLRHHSVVM